MDERLREAERRWRESGLVEDRLAWWTARARSGDLEPDAASLVELATAGRVTPDTVELLAYLGDPRGRALAQEEMIERVAADDAALRVALDEDLSFPGVAAWIHALRRWDRRLVPRALCAAAGAIVDALAALDLEAHGREQEDLVWWERYESRPEAVRWTRELLGRTRAWLESPVFALDTRGTYSVFWQTVLDAAVDAARAAIASKGGPGALTDEHALWVDGARAVGLPPGAIRAAVRDELVRRALPT
jgi:hypothetical protein